MNTNFYKMQNQHRFQIKLRYLLNTVIDYPSAVDKYLFAKRIQRNPSTNAIGPHNTDRKQPTILNPSSGASAATQRFGFGSELTVRQISFNGYSCLSSLTNRLESSGERTCLSDWVKIGISRTPTERVKKWIEKGHRKDYRVRIDEWRALKDEQLSVHREKRIDKLFANGPAYQFLARSLSWLSHSSSQSKVTRDPQFASVSGQMIWSNLRISPRSTSSHSSKPTFHSFLCPMFSPNTFAIKFHLTL